MKSEDREYQSYQQLVASAQDYVDLLNQENELNIDYYLRNPVGDLAPIRNESAAVSSDCFDVVQSDMPSIVRSVLGGGNIMEFTANNSDDKKQIREAMQKTKLINRLVLGQDWSFKVMYDWLMAAEIYNCAAVTYYPEDTEKREIIPYSGITRIELDAVMQAFEDNDKVERVEIVGDIEEGADQFDVTVHVYRKERNYIIEYIHPDNLLLTRGGPTVDDLDLVGHKSYVNKSYLISIGIDRETVKGLTGSAGQAYADQSSTTGYDQTVQDRQLDAVGGQSFELEYEPEWYMEIVELVTAVVRFADKKGSPQRRRIMSVGNTVLSDEPFDHVNYSVMSAYPLPGQVVGLSRVAVTREAQRQKSMVQRGMYNNIAAVNKPMTAINIEGGKVNPDGLLNRRVNGIVQVNGSLQDSIMPLVTPSIINESMSVIQYMDFQRAQSTGALMASQGLNKDAIYSDETATRFNGVSEEGAAKLELVLRVYADTGLKKLYRGFEWMVKHYQDSMIEEKILGEQIVYSPSDWQYDSFCNSNIGLAAGDTSELIANLGAILQSQKDLKMMGSTLVDEKKIYNTLTKLLAAMNVHDNSSYYNDPEVPEATLQAQNEQMKQLVAQLQQQVQTNPLAEAETIKAQAKLAEAQNKDSIAVAKLQSDNEQFTRQMAFDREKQREDYIKDLTELQLKYGQNVTGDLIDG